jgi:hypothetical protein
VSKVYAGGHQQVMDYSDIAAFPTVPTRSIRLLGAQADILLIRVEITVNIPRRMCSIDSFILAQMIDKASGLWLVRGPEPE